MIQFLKDSLLQLPPILGSFWTWKSSNFGIRSMWREPFYSAKRSHWNRGAKGERLVWESSAITCWRIPGVHCSRYLLAEIRSFLLRIRQVLKVFSQNENSVVRRSKRSPCCLHIWYFGCVTWDSWCLNIASDLVQMLDEGYFNFFSNCHIACEMKVESGVNGISILIFFCLKRRLETGKCHTYYLHSNLYPEVECVTPYANRLNNADIKPLHKYSTQIQ